MPKNNITIITLASLLLSGCASLGSINPFGPSKNVKPVEITTKAEEKTRLNLSEPTPLNLSAPTFIIITPENTDEVWNGLKEGNDDVVLFGLTDQGYEKLAILIAELRNFINTQRMIIKQYKEYYEPQEVKEPKQQ